MYTSSVGMVFGDGPDFTHNVVSSPTTANTVPPALLPRVCDCTLSTLMVMDAHDDCNPAMNATRPPPPLPVGYDVDPWEPPPLACTVPLPSMTLATTTMDPPLPPPPLASDLWLSTCPCSPRAYKNPANPTVPDASTSTRPPPRPPTPPHAGHSKWYWLEKKREEGRMGGG